MIFYSHETNIRLDLLLGATYDAFDSNQKKENLVSLDISWGIEEYSV